MALDWFPFYYKDFVLSKRVKKMTHEQKGAYLSLLIEAWSDPSCSLPMRASELHDLITWTGSAKDFQLVRACFTTHPEHRRRLYNPRLYREWLKAKQKSQEARASVLARWQKPASASQARKPQDRSSNGFTSVGSEVGQITDKHFPPV